MTLSKQQLYQRFILPPLAARMVDILRESRPTTPSHKKIPDTQYSLATQILRYSFLSQEARVNEDEQAIAEAEERARTYLEQVIEEYDHLQTSQDTKDLQILQPRFDTAVTFIHQAVRYARKNEVVRKLGEQECKAKIADLVNVWSKNFNIWNEAHKDQLRGMYERVLTGDLKPKLSPPLKDTVHAKRLVAKNALWDAVSDQDHLDVFEAAIADAMGLVFSGYSREDMEKIREEVAEEAIYFRHLVNISSTLKEHFGFDFELTRENENDPEVKKVLESIKVPKASGISPIASRMLENWHEAKRIAEFAYAQNGLYDEREESLISFALPRFYGLRDHRARKQFIDLYRPGTTYIVTNKAVRPQRNQTVLQLGENSTLERLRPTLERLVDESRQKSSAFIVDSDLDHQTKVSYIVDVLDRGYRGTIKIQKVDESEEYTRT
ncbi:hypothetical protein D6774_03390 [Candidatus Woesearchaeota archaeon]|nr:MAG: hypothetical protein D6774_03390 [Candidatus Woesearchaeota archaeon]